MQTFSQFFLSYNHKNGIFFSLLSYCFWEGIVGARASRSLSNRHLVFCWRGLDLAQGAWLDLWTKPRPPALGYIPPALTLMMQTFKKQLFSVQIISSLKKPSGLHLFFHTYFFLLLVFVHNSIFFFVRSFTKKRNHTFFIIKIVFFRIHAFKKQYWIGKEITYTLFTTKWDT